MFLEFAQILCSMQSRKMFTNSPAAASNGKPFWFRKHQALAESIQQKNFLPVPCGVLLGNLFVIQKDMGHRAPRRERRLPSLAAVEASAVHPTQGVCQEQLAWGEAYECMGRASARRRTSLAAQSNTCTPSARGTFDREKPRRMPGFEERGEQ